MTPSRTSPASFLKHASDVAGFYGFRSPRELERIAGNRLEKRRGVSSFEAIARLTTSAVILRPQEPALAYWATPNPVHVPAALSPREVGEFGLMVMGSSEPVSEVVILKTVASILTEWGLSLARVRVNTLGDRDSQQRFAREISLYMRKNLHALEEECREKTAQDPFAPYSCEHGACRNILPGAPRSVNYLSEKSRAHFRGVLEHLENLALPYELDDLLVGDERGAHFSFAIDLEGVDATVLSAAGGRYDEFLRKITGRKEGAGVSASVYFRKSGISRATFEARQPSRAPKIYFVQLGTRAKLQGLNILDMLRRARIPVSQSFDSAHLSPQLTAARDLKVSHMLIMGQREALDGTIIVRETQTSSQMVVQVSELPRFLKTLR